MQIITNNHERLLEYFCDLSDKDKAELDWVTDDSMPVFHYRGEVYCVDEFMRIDKYAPAEFQNWHGYQNDTFFSGILVKFCEDSDYYKVATYIA